MAIQFSGVTTADSIRLQAGTPTQAQTLTAPKRPDVFQPAFGNVVPLVRKQGRATQILTFRGLQDPLINQPPGLQMKVRGVTRHQGKLGEKVGSIGKLAASNWKDGQRINFTIGRRGIDLTVPGFGPIGSVPPEIGQKILPVIQKYPNRFQFELSNVIAGTTKGAPTIGMRVNLVYTGQSKSEADDIRIAFNMVLNDPRCKDAAMLYQAPTSPEQVLKLILRHEEVTKGKAAAHQMETVINTITDKIKDPNNKRILLLGHCKPDGDTLGCIVGLKNAIELMDPTRTVECAVDDKIPGLFRNKVPGMDTIKHPTNPAKVVEIDRMLVDLRHKLANPTGLPQDKPELLKGRIQALENEKKILSNKANLLDPKAKYDLVITMDIPTPTRFTDKFKPYLQNAKDVVYIDHHPHRFNEWDAAKNETGLDMAAVQKKNLAWVADSVGACAQMMTVIGDKLLPQMRQIANGAPLAKIFPDPAQQEKLARYVANLVTGMSTDTGSFTRTANLLSTDMNKPVEQRPNFQPEGVAKWLMNTTQAMPQGGINKKWLRENVTYGVSDAAHDLMMEFATRGTRPDSKLGFGVVQVDYDQMNAVWQTAMEQDGAVTLLDIQNEFKYSQVMGDLKGMPGEDKIAVLICQDKKKGELDEKLQIAKDNGLRLSIRSSNGTEHAELLASLFNGGGHGAAAGARVDLPGVELNTPLGVTVNGVATKDTRLILQTMRRNLEVLHNNTLTDAQKKAQLTPLKVVEDPTGKPCADLMTDIVAEMRKSQPAGAPTRPQRGGQRPGNRFHPPSFKKDDCCDE